MSYRPPVSISLHESDEQVVSEASDPDSARPGRTCPTNVLPIGPIRGFLIGVAATGYWSALLQLLVDLRR